MQELSSPNHKVVKARIWSPSRLYLMADQLVGVSENELLHSFDILYPIGFPRFTIIG
jgi:hypothetical protein